MQVPFSTPRYIYSLCLLRLFWAVPWGFIRLPCLWWLDSFKEQWSGILLNVPLLGFVWYLSYDETGVIGFEEEDYKDEVYFSPRHIKGACYQHGLSSMMVISITWLAFVRFFSLSGYFSSFSMLYSGRMLPCTTHTYGVGSSYIRYLKLFCMGDLSSLSNLCIYLFNHLFLSVCTHEYLF